MKQRIIASYKYICAESGVELDPPKPGELFLGHGLSEECVVLRETGDGSEFVDVGTYLEIRKKYGV